MYKNLHNKRLESDYDNQTQYHIIKGENRMQLKNILLYLSSLMLFAIIGCEDSDDSGSRVNSDKPAFDRPDDDRSPQRSTKSKSTRRKSKYKSGGSV